MFQPAMVDYLQGFALRCCEHTAPRNDLRSTRMRRFCMHSRRRQCSIWFTLNITSIIQCLSLQNLPYNILYIIIYIYMYTYLNQDIRSMIILWSLWSTCCSSPSMCFRVFSNFEHVDPANSPGLKQIWSRGVLAFLLQAQWEEMFYLDIQSCFLESWICVF